jgi:hypothetical protein
MAGVVTCYACACKYVYNTRGGSKPDLGLGHWRLESLCYCMAFRQSGVLVFPNSYICFYASYPQLFF